MKVRESGMPEKKIWEEFFEPETILEAMGVDEAVKDIVDFGCGYGTFSIPAAKMVSGIVYALDIELEMIELTKKRAEESGLSNIKTILRDFVSNGTGLKNESVDYVMLFNILHVENPVKLLHEARRILRQRGKVGIIHWNYDPRTPRGPPMAMRPKPRQCAEWVLQAGFINPIRHDLKPYHFGIVAEKKRKE